MRYNTALLFITKKKKIQKNTESLSNSAKKNKEQLRLCFSCFSHFLVPKVLENLQVPERTQACCLHSRDVTAK